MSNFLRASAIYDLVLADKSALGRDAFISSLGEVEGAVGALAVGGFAGLAVAGVGAFTALYVAQEPLITQLGNTSRELGINVVALQAMEAAAAGAGIGASTLSSALSTAIGNIDQAAVGAGKAGTAIQSIGLQTAKLQQLAPEEKIYAVMKALEGVESISQRIEFAERIFGGSASDMIRLMSEDIDDAAGYMENLGLALQQVDFYAISEVNEELNRFQTLTTQSSKLFVTAMTPAILAVARQFFDLSAGTGNVRESMIGLADTAIMVLGWMGDRVNDVRRFVTGLEFTFQNMGTQFLILLDKIPGLDLGDKIREEFNKGIDIYEKYLKIDENGKFSERLKQNLADVRADAEAAAKQIAEIQGRDYTQPFTGDIGNLLGKDATAKSANDPLSEEKGDSIEASVDKALAREKAKAERIEAWELEREAYKIERLRQYGLTELEVLLETQQRTSDFLDEVAEKDKSRAVEVATIKEAANQKYHDRYLVLLKKRQDESGKREKAQMEAGRSYIEQGIEHFAAQSKLADVIHKALTARRMFREGREAVIGAYKFGNSLGGPALGAAFAGVAIVYTAALIAEAVGGSGGGTAAPGGVPDAAEVDSSEFDNSNGTDKYTGPQTVTYNAYFTRNIPESERAAMAAESFEAEVKANRIVIGDNTRVQFNQYDYEEYGT